MKTQNLKSSYDAPLLSYASQSSLFLLYILNSSYSRHQGWIFQHFYISIFPYIPNMSGLFDNTRNFSFYAVCECKLSPIMLSNDQFADSCCLGCSIPSSRLCSLSVQVRQQVTKNLQQNCWERPDHWPSCKAFCPLVHEWQSTNALQTKDKIIRCEGAQSNGFENLAFFATAVVAGNLAGLPSETLNTLSFGYIASRVVYNFIYITNTTGAMASLRSVVFLTGIGQIFTLFNKSGNALRDKAANLI